MGGGDVDEDEGEVERGVVAGRRGKQGMVDDAEADLDWEAEEVGFGRSSDGRTTGLGGGRGGGLRVYNVHGDGLVDGTRCLKEASFRRAIGRLSEDWSCSRREEARLV